ncbi:hypothetical protein CCMA1212_005031 [Trichoderma ghanense]|uniref:Uncharacterized protein n=1 Tax=Trichoderma ghanense TaxID=65468 RepID=A0ABY2H568_9HYPO
MSETKTPYYLTCIRLYTSFFLLVILIILVLIFSIPFFLIILLRQINILLTILFVLLLIIIPLQPSLLILLPLLLILLPRLSKHLCALRPRRRLRHDVRPERRLGRVKVLEEGAHLAAVLGRKVHPRALLLDELGVGLELLHQHGELRDELGVLVAARLGADLLQPALELDDDGEGELGEGDGLGPDVQEAAHQLGHLVADAVLVDARAEIGLGGSVGDGKVQGLERRRLRGFLHLGRVEHLQQRRGQRYVDVGGLRQRQQRADEVEAEGEVEGCRDEAHRAEGDLHEGVDERPQLALLAGLGLLQGRAVLGEDAGPEVERVGELPVVDHAERVVLVVDDAVAEVDGELADKGKGRGVANGRVDAPEPGRRELHHVDARERVVVGDAAALDEALVDGLEDGLADALVADDDEPSNDSESGHARRVGAGGLSPQVDHGLGQGLDELLEGEQVWQNLHNGQERDCDCAVVGKRAEEVHDGGDVRLEQQRQGLELLALRLHVDFASRGLLHGQVVVHNQRHLLESEQQNVVEDFGAVDGPSLVCLALLVGLVQLLVRVFLAGTELVHLCKICVFVKIQRFGVVLLQELVELGILLGKALHGFFAHARPSGIVVVVVVAAVILAVARNRRAVDRHLRIASIARLVLRLLGVASLPLAQLACLGLVVDNVLEAALEEIVDAHLGDLLGLAGRLLDGGGSILALF